MVSDLKHRAVSFWLILTSLLPYGGRLVVNASQTGKATTGAVVAAAGVAGGAGAVVAVRVLRRAPAMFRRTGELSEALYGSSARADQYDIMALRATQEPYWEEFSRTLAQTPAASGLSEARRLEKWPKDPAFRATVFEELQNSNPERLNRLVSGAQARMLDPRGLSSVEEVWRAQIREEVERAAIGGVVWNTVQTEEVLLYDAHDKLIPKKSPRWRSASDVVRDVRETAYRLLDQELAKVRPSELRSEKAVREVLAKTFASCPEFRYSCDLTTGMLKVTYKRPGGDITAAINIYAAAATLYGWYRYTRPGQPEPEPESAADSSSGTG